MVSNADVVRTLERIADLLEIRGENTFKVRACRLAALQVGNLGRPLRAHGGDAVARGRHHHARRARRGGPARRPRRAPQAGHTHRRVDCRAAAPVSSGAVLQYFTGSQAHNIRLRGRALRMGMTLDEYGVFRIDDGARVAGETEDDVYAALRLPWIPPQCREDPTEIDVVELITVATEV